MAGHSGACSTPRPRLGGRRPGLYGWCPTPVNRREGSASRHARGLPRRGRTATPRGRGRAGGRRPRPSASDRLSRQGSGWRSCTTPAAEGHRGGPWRVRTPAAPGARAGAPVRRRAPPGHHPVPTLLLGCGESASARHPQPSGTRSGPTGCASPGEGPGWPRLAPGSASVLAGQPVRRGGQVPRPGQDTGPHSSWPAVGTPRKAVTVHPASSDYQHV